MKKLRLKKGVHPPEGKITASHEIKDFAPPEVLMIPLTQHRGKPAQPLVIRGDEVKIGQKIGQPQGEFSASVHSPVCGKVRSIEPIMLPDGRIENAIIVQNNGKTESSAPTWPVKDIDELTPEEIRTIAREAGIVGLGGAVFPTHIKISPSQDLKVETVIINGTECEPFLTADHRLMVEKPEDVLKGARLVKKATGAEEVFVAVEDNKLDAIEILSKLAKDYENFTVISLKSRYPQGAEKNLIKVILKREVPAGGFPLHVGVVVNNVGTVFSLYQAATKGIPLTRRVVTVSGDGLNKGGNYMIPVGTPVNEVLKAAEVDFDKTKKLIHGGPMMGVAMKNVNVPVLKSTSGLLCFTEHYVRKEYPCLYCGKCAGVCTLGVIPTILVRTIKAGQWGRAQKIGIFNCMECGCCAYVCPSNIPLVQWIKYGKYMVQREAVNQ